MRIKKIGCEQFAGLKDRDIDFEDGLNIVVGENESGKSTLIDLIYRLFFQSEKVDGRTDKDFKERYFPNTAGDYKADFIDGVIRFETEKGAYKLSKEWSARGTCKLTLPDGTAISDGNRISSILAEELQFGRGVYDELIFASQRREQTILESILGKKPSDNMNDLSTVLTRAVMETGGIAIDEMEKELNDTVKGFEGNWDFVHDMPRDGVKRGIKNEWKTNVGSILSAYYKKEEIAANRENAEQAERKVERINEEIQKKKEKQKNDEDGRDEFSKFRSRIEIQANNRQTLAAARKEWGEMKKALEDWPDKAEKRARAEELKTALQEAQAKEQYRAVKEQVDAIAEKQSELDGSGEIDAVEVNEAADLEKQIAVMEARLKGMNLSLRIKKLGDADIQVKSSVTGQNIGDGLDTIAIKEAVDILIPHVAEIGIAPVGVDVEQTRNELNGKQTRLTEILEKYAVASAEKLKEKQRHADELTAELGRLREKKELLLNGRTWEELSDQASRISDDIREASAISADLSKLCGGQSPDSFIGRLTGEIDQYKEKYQSVAMLTEAEKSKRDEVRKLEERVNSMDAVPEKYAQIKEPEEYDKGLKAKIDRLDAEIEELHQEHSEATRALGEKSAEEYSDEYRTAEQEFQSKKAEYSHWKHIQEVFVAVKDSAKGNPMEDVERYFREYLSMLTDGAVSLAEISEDLGSSITSGRYQLTSGTLSDGTKDTITLAFRLAVLEHLYPNGGCVAVFDDPFTDMDPKRTAQACALIQKFAEKNQVIFVTCDAKYQALLKGKVIPVAK